MPYGPAGLMAKVVGTFGLRATRSRGSCREDEYGVVDRFVPLHRAQPRGCCSRRGVSPPWLIATIPRAGLTTLGSLRSSTTFQSLAAQDLKTIATGAWLRDNPAAGTRPGQADRRPADRLSLQAQCCHCFASSSCSGCCGRSALLADLLVTHTRTSDANHATGGATRLALRE